MKNNSESREEFIETIKGMFVPFTGYYEKKYYDIQLPDWTIIEKCWPNAWTIWSRTGKQYWPWECYFRLSKIDWNPIQNTWIDSIRLIIINNFNEILDKFNDENLKKHLMWLLNLATMEDIEALRIIIKNSNKANLALFCRFLFDWDDIKWNIKILITFAHILKDWNPEILKTIFNSAKSRREILNILLKW